MTHDRSISLRPLFLVLLLALGLRLAFFQGFAFSDDAHYAWLAAHPGAQFGVDYPGYPVMPLRVGHLFLLGLSQHWFGPGDWGLAFFPLMFSLAMIAIAWRLGCLLGGHGHVGNAAALLLALLPVDIALSTLAFADLSAAAMLGLGVWLLLEARHTARHWLRVPGALVLGLSLLWKETVLWLVPVILAIQFGIWLRDFRRGTPLRPDATLLAAGLGILLVLGLESLVYALLHGDPLWRFHQMELNTRLCPDDFFKLGSAKGYATPEERPAALARLLLWSKPKALFLRRNTLFILALALVQLLRRLRRHDPGPQGLWFGGLLLMFLFGSTSLQRYQPLPLDLPWYIYPLFLPAALLAGELLAELPWRRFRWLLAPLLALSLWMCLDFRNYFDHSGLQEVRAALSASPTTPVYGDPFSLLSLDHLDGQPSVSRGIPLGDSGPAGLDLPPPGALLLLNPGNLRELRAQGHDPVSVPAGSNPDWTLLSSGGGFLLFQRLH